MTTDSFRKGVMLQKRDLLLLRMLAEEFRILTSEQIGKLLPMGSVSRLNFRLKQLGDAGYLSYRVLMRMGSVIKKGYYLGPQASTAFDDPTERRIVKLIRTQVVQLADSGLMHRMLVDSIHIRFLTACRDYPNYQLITWIDQYSPWWEEFRAYAAAFQADGYGEYVQLMSFDNLFTFFLEVDRGTERGHAIEEKLDRYIEYAASGMYEHQFAAKPFRVLVITTGKERIHQLLEMAKAKGGSTFFWMTTWDDFQKSKLFDAYWVRPGLGGRHSLLTHHE